MKDSDMMHNAFKKSLKEFELVLEGKRPMSELTAGSLAFISNYAKIRQTETHSEGIALASEKFKYHKDKIKKIAK